MKEEEILKLKKENIDLKKQLAKINITKAKDRLIKSFIPKVPYTLVQCAMFFVSYGLGYKMPWWAIWFPTLIYFIIVVVLLVFLIIIMALEVFLDRT